MLLNSSRARAGRNKSEIFKNQNSKYIRIVFAFWFSTELILTPLLCILYQVYFIRFLVGAASSRDRDQNEAHIAAARMKSVGMQAKSAPTIKIP